MKKIILFLIVGLCSAHSQNINFPDGNLKAKLLSPNVAQGQGSAYITIDSNGDSEISMAEAALVHKLFINEANITNLEGVQHFVNVTTLSFSFNPITDVSVLMDMPQLTNVSCNAIQLDTLNLTYLTNLQTLLCEGSGIDTLVISGMQNLHTIYCGTNDFTQLNLTNLPNLGVFHCSASNLSSLDLSNLTNLHSLYLYSNPSLAYVNIKNGTDENIESMNFTDTPSLNYVCADDSQVTAVRQRLDFFGNTYSVVNSYCSFEPGGVNFDIQGNSRADSNNNDICEETDASVPYVKFALSGNSQFGTMMANESGAYHIPVSAGTHTITPVMENPSYYSVSPSSATVTFPAAGSLWVQNFCLLPNGLFPDLEVIAISTTGIQPGFNSEFKILYKNKGTTTLSGAVTFNYDETLANFVEASLPAVENTGTLTWEFSNLNPFETREIELSLLMNTPTDTPPLDLGDLLQFDISIEPSIGDMTPIDNNFSLNLEVVNSMDPNDKTCLEGSVIQPSQVGKYVHYLIRFENLGTANATNVVVKDVISSTRFSIGSLVPISGSHPFTTRIKNGTVEFIFEGINLPFDDANNDGYVLFKIKTLPTLGVGQTFSNQASIYFDYNTPIITNQAITEIQALSNSNFEFSQYFKLAPNPSSELMTILSTGNVSINFVSIYNITGQLLRTEIGQQETVDISELQTGTYFLKLNTDKGATTTRFIKL